MPVCTLSFPACGSPNLYLEQSLAGLLKSCTNKNDIELIVKLDHYEDIDYYIKLLTNSGFVYKVLIYDQLQGIADAHFWHYDMASLSKSSMIWLFADDIVVDCKNLGQELSKVMSLFSDSVYILYGRHFKGNRCRLGDKHPIISKKLIDCMQLVSPHCGLDRFYRTLANYKRFANRAIVNDSIGFISLVHRRRRVKKNEETKDEHLHRTFVLHDNRFVYDLSDKYIGPYMIPVKFDLLNEQIKNIGVRMLAPRCDVGCVASSETAC